MQEQHSRLSLIPFIITASLLIASCVSHNDKACQKQIAEGLDSLKWIEQYNITGWGNADLDSIPVSSPYRIRYSYKGQPNSTLSIFEKNPSQEIVQIVMDMRPQDNFVSRVSTSKNSTLKILADNTTKWSICIDELNNSYSEVDSLVKIGKVSSEMLAFRDSLVKNKINSLNADTIDYSLTRSCLRDWQTLGITDCTDYNSYLFDGKFHIQGGPFKITGWYEIPSSYRDYWFNDCEVVLIDHSRNTKTRICKPQYGHHNISYETDLEEGTYSLDYGKAWVGEIYFTVQAYQE